MRVTHYDLSRYQAMLEALEFMLRHRRGRPTTRSDELYYQLLAEYYRRPLRAREEGKMVVAQAAYVPSEILYAMDLVPLHLESTAIIAPSVLKNFEELAGIAKGFGLTPEVCSAHRSQAAWFVKGWLPRPDAVLWSQQICDSISHSGNLLRELYDLPGFFLDRPYRTGEAEMRYYAASLAEMVSFLEGLTGKKLDMDRLCQALQYAAETRRLAGEIYSLSGQVPCPVPNRVGEQVFNISNWLYLGAPEGVEFARAALEEAQERARGNLPRERFRLMGLYPPPAYRWKLMDWMEREHRAAIVARPYVFHWGEWPPDYSHPLESLARRCFAIPVSRQFHGPAMKAMVPDAIADALNNRAQGAFYFAHINCRHGCAMIRMVKDALMEQAGIPTLVVDTDVLDPSFISDEEMRDKFEGFFEQLAERQGDGL